MRKILKKENGITLIALIITIIVLLILSGISIATLLGDNGILKQARESTVKSKEAQIEEEIRLAYNAMQIADYEKEWGIDKRAEELEKELKKIDSSAAVGVNGTDLKIVYKGYETTISERGIMGELTKGDGVTMLNGDGQTYYTLAPTSLSFRSSANIDDFQEVQINGETIDPSNYTMAEGSTIINLSIDYLKTLAEDDYSISIVSKTGSPSAGFSVIEPDLNEHGFYYNQPYTAYVPDFDIKMTFFIREDSTVDVFGNGLFAEVCTYTNERDNITIEASLGNYTCEVSSEGAEIYCNELGVNFVLGDESVVADEEYIYFYNEKLGGYRVNVIDNTKSTYGPIKNGIYRKRTVELANSIFENNDKITEIPEIPQSSIRIVGENAFSGCSNLTKAVLPDSVREIGMNAFAFCSKLTNFEFPPYIEYICENTFKGCNSLTDIVIPSDVKSIEAGAFEGCTSLESVCFWDSVKSISDNAFANCTSLTSIEYKGNKEEWSKISFGKDWNLNVPATTVICIDGRVEL